MANFLINLYCGFFILLAVISCFMGKANASEEWTKQTYIKQAKLKSLGYSDTLSRYIIKQCKKQAKNAEHCVTTAGFIGKAESNAGQNAYKNNVWGINEGKTYKTPEKNFDRWIKSYLKYWYKTNHPRDFYPPKGQVSKTRYCTDEVSSGSIVGCPNGLKISTKTFNFLKS